MRQTMFDLHRLWIVQPYVPAYRVPFFEGLRASLSFYRIEVNVVASTPSRGQALRGDSARPDWLFTAPSRSVGAFGRSVGLSNTRRYWQGASAVIFPHMGSSLELNWALRFKGDRRIGVWGHVAPYVSKAHPIDAAVERWQRRRADQIFAYTPSGADYAVATGAKPEQVTTVMNTIDTAQLESEIAQITPSDVQEFRLRHGVPAGPLISYVGGLDASKRVDFLRDSLDILHRRNPAVHVLVAGRGSDAAMLEPAVRRGQVTLLGYVTGREKALAMKAGLALLNPGRVGLIAVDALVAGRPVITTRWLYHAPEIEYLRDGETVFFSDDSPQSFAETVLSFAGSERARDLRGLPYPTMEKMIENFSEGVLRMLGDRR